FVGHARLIGFLTLISRILGMGREAIAAHYFGDGLVWSAFTVAFTIPNLFRKLFGEGALSAAFIPLYAAAVKREADGGDGAAGLEGAVEMSAGDFAAASVNLLAAILLALTVLGEGLLWALAIIGDPRPDRLLMIKLTAIMLPYVVLVCGTAFLGAILQVHRKFGAPAAAPVILNVVHIAVIAVGAKLMHLTATSANPNDPQLMARQTTLAYWLAGFVLVAGALQMALLLPDLKRVGFRFRWVRHFWTGAIRRMLKLSLPVALGAGVLQLSVLLDTGISFLLTPSPNAAGQIATHFSLLGQVFKYPMEMGAPARLKWAQFLYQFPLGIFAIALATAIFPGLSRDAADKDRTRFRGVMRHGIEMTLLEGLPASIGLILVATPAIQLLFQHGKFTSEATAWVARSLVFYSAAIWAFSLQQILNRAYYALHNTITPLVLSIITLVVNTLVELPMVWTRLGESGMAAGTCISFILQALLMLYLLDRKIGGLELGKSAGNIVKMLIATALMTGACIAVKYSPIYPKVAAHRSQAALQLALLLAVGAGVYFAACAGMGIPGLSELVPKRLRRKAP
ncbi:MAG TPA: murein biosynthesis integral membrane protein MurJ, partial [Tepidisphaeraceae bacterium]